MYGRVIARILTCLSALLLIASSIVFSSCTKNPSTISSQSTTVAVPIVSLIVSPAAVLPGQSATLTWSATSASSCTAGGAWSGSPQMSGSMNVTLSSPANQTYVLECAGTGGPAIRKSVTLSLSQADGACTSNHAIVTARGRHIGKRRAPNGHS